MPNQIQLYGEIGVDAKAFDIKKQIDAMDATQPLVVRIHSEGGSVFDGLALYDAFKAYSGPKKAIIESAAFSIASYIAMAFDEVEITENGYLMIHNPWMECGGDDAEHSRAADVLAKLKASMLAAYSQKTGKTETEVLEIMADETWINSTEALAQGYVNSVIQAKPVEMRAVAKLKNMPQGVLRSLCGDRSDAGDDREKTKEKTMSTTSPVAASLAEIKAALPKAKAEFIVRCLERQLPIASVMTEAAVTLEEENMALRAELEEMKTAKAKAMEEEELKAKAMEDEELKAKAMEEEESAKAKARSGVRPVGKSASSFGGAKSATSQWKAALNAKVALGVPRAKAIDEIEAESPGLREKMVEEANA